MAATHPNWSTQQLTEFLDRVSSPSTEEEACQLAVERAAEALDAEIGALVRVEEVICSIGFPPGEAPERELIALATGAVDTLAVSGIGDCRGIRIPVEDDLATVMVLARHGEQSFGAEEVNLARGMGRVLALALRLFRLAAQERSLRKDAERQYELNEHLLGTLEERQALLERLSRIQRSITHSVAREEVFGAIADGARELLRDDTAALLLREPEEPRRLVIASVSGRSTLSPGDRAPRGSGIAQRAMRERALVVEADYQHAIGALPELKRDGLSAAMGAPVHEHGEVVGCLVVASFKPDRDYTTGEREVLQAFAEHASLALTDTRRIEAQRERTARSVEEHYEARLRQVQRLETVGQLAGGIAHDFNNLLAVILNSADFALDELGRDDPTREDVREIRKAAERAAELTSQLLVFSRRGVVRAQVVNLTEILEDVEGLLERTLTENIELEIEVEPSLPPVKADPGQLEQVILNLAVNARDAMHEGGLLEIELAALELEAPAAKAHDLEPGTHVRMMVRDSGRGMSEWEIEHAFEPFFSTKPKGQGTGLGLATVYGIVTQAGGRIEIDSELGGGTTMTIYFPATEEVAPDRGESEAAPSEGAGDATILVVEDEEAVRRLTCRILSSQGYSVVEASDGQSALRAWEASGNKVDLLLTDVVMPGMSGKELAERLSQYQPDLVPVFMSGYTDDVVLRHGINGEIPNLVQKPFGAEALLSAVRGALQGERP
jgi:signal transduction histidine kinase/ActR/RegA family two-component response regulator